MAGQDYYQTLGVTKSASDAELKSAYRKAALKWHPDKHRGDDKKKAEEKFKEINQAYEVLKDPNKKSMYDQLGHDAFTRNGGASAAGSQGGNPFAGGFGGQQGPFRYTYTTRGNAEDFGGFSDPFEIFEQFFGGGGGFGRQAKRKQVYQMSIDFMDAVQGITKNVVIQGDQKEIKIPAGVGDGNRIRFSDFDVVVSVKAHDTFKRQGQDIVVDVPISFSLAALGGKKEVPTIDGNYKLKVRSGTQSGTLLRLKGKGVKYPNRNQRGDQYVRFIVEIPKKLSRKQKKLLKEFEETS